MTRVPRFTRNVSLLQIAFLSMAKPNGHGDRAGVTLTWRDLSVYVTTPSSGSSGKAPFKRVLNNGIYHDCEKIRL